MPGTSPGMTREGESSLSYFGCSFSAAELMQ
jgi:hypothetical protein